jgi:hypothetical protein
MMIMEIKLQNTDIIFSSNPWNKALLGKTTVPLPVKELVFYGT